MPSGPAPRSPCVLFIGAVDPAGRSGLTRQAAVAARARTAALTVSTGQTVQHSGAYGHAHAVPPDVLREAIAAACQEQAPTAVCVGALLGPDQVRAVAEALADVEAPLVLDPVHGPSAGGAFLDEAGRQALMHHLVPRASLVAPNAEEARGLTGAEGREAAHCLLDLGAQAVLVTAGGQGPDHLWTREGVQALPVAPQAGSHRGTGCRSAAQIAVRLAAGVPLEAAVEGAHRSLQRELAADAARQAVDPARAALLQELEAWLPRLLDVLPGRSVPEVGMNLAYALPGATDPRRDVAGLAGRIAIAGDHHDICGELAFGGPHHTGRLAVVLQELAPAARIVLNHRFDRRFLEAARAAGLSDARFSRAEEPPEVPSTMEWGLREALRAHREATGDPTAWPDLVWDEGGLGKEPMVRVLARGPADLVVKLRLLHPTDNC